MKQRLSLVTLAVDDLSRSLAFYRDGLGWTPHFAADDVAFFQMNAMVFALFRKEELAKDFGGAVAMGGKSIALAHNVADKAEVDTVLDEVRTLDGGTVVFEPADRFWGGYSGYFEDPDGHLWEVAWNPHWTLSPEGSVTM